MFGVLASYGYPVVEITRVTELCFWSKGGRYRGEREVRAYLEKLICFGPDKAAVELASKRLASAEAERDRRMARARRWFAEQTAKIASGIEAAAADETRSGSAVGESPAPNGGDAQ